MGSGALAIALPFACILGLLATIIASNVGKIQSLQNPTNCCSYCFLQESTWDSFCFMFYAKELCTHFKLLHIVAEVHIG